MTSPIRPLESAPLRQTKDLLGDGVRARETNDLVFGVTGYIGSGLSHVAEALGEKLRELRFALHEVTLSDLLAKEGGVQRTASKTIDDIVALQDAGDRLREKHGQSIVAGLGIRDIYQQRKVLKEPRVFMMDSIKHPKEVEVLRAVYGRGFYLIGVLCNYEERLRRLKFKFKKEQDKSRIEEGCSRLGGRHCDRHACRDKSGRPSWASVSKSWRRGPMILRHLEEASTPTTAPRIGVASLGPMESQSPFVATTGPQGGTLYCTTFPCHSCARHIVAAGLKEVVYLEPYTKSLALELHADALREISVKGRDGDGHESEDPRVVLRLFTGFAPRRFAALFEKRRDLKDKQGVLVVLGDGAAHADPVLNRSFLQIEEELAETVDSALQGKNADGEQGPTDPSRG